LAQNHNDETGYGRGLQFLKWILCAAVLASFAFLTVIFVQRIVGRKAVVHAPSVPSPVAARVESDSVVAPSKVAETTSGGATRLGAHGVPPAVSESPKEAWPAPGGLLVYENGKEIFRTPSPADANANQSAPIMERAGIHELSPEAAEGSLIHRVEPDYPEEARRQQIQGAVVLEVRAAGDGSVQEVSLISGPPLLTDAAIAAAKQWRFKPRTKQGKPVGTQMKVTLNFKLPTTGPAEGKDPQR
jgi:protein TonB